jgi:hypothetical protein
VRIENSWTPPSIRPTDAVAWQVRNKHHLTADVQPPVKQSAGVLPIVLAVATGIADWRIEGTGLQ